MTGVTNVILSRCRHWYTAAACLIKRATNRLRTRFPQQKLSLSRRCYCAHWHQVKTSRLRTKLEYQPGWILLRTRKRVLRLLNPTISSGFWRFSWCLYHSYAGVSLWALELHNILDVFAWGRTSHLIEQWQMTHWIAVHSGSQSENNVIFHWHQVLFSKPEKFCSSTICEYKHFIWITRMHALVTKLVNRTCISDIRVTSASIVHVTYDTLRRTGATTPDQTWEAFLN